MRQFFIFGMMFVFFLSGCSEAPSAETTESFRIVFAADFATGEGCATHETDGCDLYYAEIDSFATVKQIIRLTTTSEPEVFPVFSTDGLMVYANQTLGKEKNKITWAALDGNDQGTFQESAVGPAPLPDGRLLYLSIPGFKITIDGQTVSENTNYHEPHVSANGQVIFYRLFNAGKGSNTAQVVMYDPITKVFTELTAQDGTAHCFWNGTGTAAVCNNTSLYRGLFNVPIDGSLSSLLIEHPTVEEVAALDGDFSSCRSVHYAYGAFCDETHMVVTVGCALETDGVVDTTFSKLGLVDFSTPLPTLHMVGNNLADAFEGMGSSSYTVDCELAL